LPREYATGMLTIFSVPKRFRGHINVTQRNALASWKRLHSDAEVILFGTDQGTEEACQEFGFRHEPVVEHNEFGSVLVNSLFAKAQAIARHNVLCYVNCDIVLMGDFLRAVQRVRAAHAEFLMVGRRWDVEITELLEFDQRGWQVELAELVRKQGRQRDGDWIDYFAFNRGLYGSDVPPFAIGRTAWDNWLVWCALSRKKSVVDASRVVQAVHQNHDYAHVAGGEEHVWRGSEARRNFELMGGAGRIGRIDDATFLLEPQGLRRNYKGIWSRFVRQLECRYVLLGEELTYKIWLPTWHLFLNITRPLRRVLGLTSSSSRR
jgi:hypothetical protein